MYIDVYACACISAKSQKSGFLCITIILRIPNSLFGIS